MKVFLSWSGDRSRHIAESLRTWLPRVIQAVRPWMSDIDIPAGARWQTDIAHELDAADFGIICVTPENINKPWLMFEAGALSKSMKASRVCPLAFSMELHDLSGPIAQFQANKLDRDGVLQVLKAINASMGDQGLDQTHLSEQFEMLWSRLDKALEAIPTYEPPAAEQPTKSPVTSLEADEIMKFLHRVAVKNETLYPNSAEPYTVYAAESSQEYVTGNQVLYYAPVSNLEGALSGVIVKPSSASSLRKLVATIHEDLEAWFSVASAVPSVSIDLSGPGQVLKEQLTILSELGRNFPNSVEIGLSETQLTSNPRDMIEMLREFRATGLTFGVKEFGTGYSSLNWLKEFPIGSLWIDKSFIRDIAISKADREIASAIAALAKSLELAVIAEGVATLAQSTVLLEIGVKNISGSMAGDLMTSSDVYSLIST
ncbi:EAL domain-containing protein [Massilia sp. AB1]|uniref:EAL domain-containing protein n=1 Tax=Massilia sp. AB1 TaxID=2823371 RepID=UPI001B82F302|nr:EAL domain-containing protein [Massilia sp. AB1]MBQ5939860.1 EAL domain-containing protein [Massilia sp. AB1]